MHPGSPHYQRPPATGDELIARAIDRLTGSFELAMASLDRRIADLTQAIIQTRLSDPGPAELAILLRTRQGVDG